MKTARYCLLALYGLALAAPCALADKKSGGGNRVTITYTYRVHYYYKPGGVKRPAPARDLSVLAPPPASPQTYHWLDVGDEDAPLYVLFRGTDQIGQYDAAEKVYRRINTDGTFSDPAPRPWRTAHTTVPPPPLPVAKQAPPKETDVAARPAEDAEVDENKPQAPVAGQSQVEKLLREMPPWSLYAGGGLAGLALVFGFLAYGRKQ